MGDEVFTGTNLPLMFLSREFTMYQRKCTDQKEAIRLILCYPNGEIYKRYTDKVGDMQLCKDMRDLLKRCRGDRAERAELRAYAAKKWMELKFKQYNLQNKIKKERADFSKQTAKNKKTPQTIIRLEDDLKKLNEDLDYYERMTKEMFEVKDFKK